MRKIWLCAALLAMLVGAAYAECQHWVQCQEPAVCVACGAQDVSVSENEVSHEWLYADLGQTHQLFCLYCDYEEEPQEHFALCETPDVCEGCGAKGLTLPVDCLIHDGEYVDLGTQHQYNCTGCGLQDAPENHWANCDDPVTCAGCGMTGCDIPEDEIYHSLMYLLLEGQHQLVCEGCSYAESPAEHTAVCTNPERCYDCGATIDAVALEELLHYAEYIAIRVTDAEHEKYCTHCDYSWGAKAHQVSCADPTACTECSKTGLNGADYSYSHEGPITGLTTDQGGHSFACEHCGTRVENEAHTFDDGFCCICGYEQEADAPEIPDAPARIPGDADDDGAVTIMDALLVLQYDVGWNVDINASNADVDGDGAVTIMDALRILQYDVGWDVELL